MPSQVMMQKRAPLNIRVLDRAHRNTPPCIIICPALGRKVLEVSKPRPVTVVEGGHDDGIKELNEGRFLRPPQDPEEFWKRIPLDYEAGEKQHWRDYTGTRDSMPAGETDSRQ